MKKLTLLLFLSLLLNSLEGTAQKRSLQIGGKLINEFTFNDGSAPGIGAQIVYRMGKHGGIESGLNYQNRYFGFFITVDYSGTTYTYFTKIAEHHLQIPLLYRYDSKKINFSVGPIIDYFIGWNVKRKDPGVTVNSYDRNTVSFIASASASRSFYLSPTVILEPEIRFNFIPADADGGLALNIALRKKLF